MEVLSSRILLRPRDFDRSLRFYRDVLGLHVYREWGGGTARGVVFFLGGGFLELSRQASERPSDTLQIWFEVRDVDAVHRQLAGAGLTIDEPPDDKPWGLREMRIQDPDGTRLVVVQVPEDHPLRRRS